MRSFDGRLSTVNCCHPKKAGFIVGFDILNKHDNSPRESFFLLGSKISFPLDVIKVQVRLGLSSYMSNIRLNPE